MLSAKTLDKKTGQNRTGQKKTGQNCTGQKQTGQNHTGQKQTGQNRTGQKKLDNIVTDKIILDKKTGHFRYHPSMTNALNDQCTQPIQLTTS